MPLSHCSHGVWCGGGEIFRRNDLMSMLGCLDLGSAIMKRVELPEQEA